MKGIERIAVGMDGSENASAALRWAVDEAGVHGATVEVVVAWGFLDQHHADRSDTFDPHYTEASARAALASWVIEVLGPDASVDQRAVCDLPARALLEASDAADLLVLGGRGAGGFEGLLLGSVSERVAQLATRPVAVVRRPAPVVGGQVVVGIDGSARSLDALRWAAAEARVREAGLHVVHAWRLPTVGLPQAISLLPDLTALEEAGRVVLSAALADPAVRGIRTEPHLTSESPARALIERSAGAALVVIGTRGLGRITSAALGSVSRQLVQHASCPVVVI